MFKIDDKKNNKQITGIINLKTYKVNKNRSNY